jgi:hypothetical protein
VSLAGHGVIEWYSFTTWGLSRLFGNCWSSTIWGMNNGCGDFVSVGSNAHIWSCWWSFTIWISIMFYTFGSTVWSVNNISLFSVRCGWLAWKFGLNFSNVAIGGWLKSFVLGFLTWWYWNISSFVNGSIWISGWSCWLFRCGWSGYWYAGWESDVLVACSLWIGNSTN